jgi:membrane associated rhomboid family serine protease
VFNEIACYNGSELEGFSVDWERRSTLIPLRDINPTLRFPILTVVLIAINVVVFIIELILFASGVLPQTVYTMGVIPFDVTHHFGPLVIINFFTSMFMHGGLVHIIGNMLYLWIFGNNVEDVMGRGRFIIFYLLCGLVASGAQVLANPNSPIPSIGASGAIAGVLGAYILLFPRAQVETLLIMGYFVRLVRVPALIVLSFWFVIQLFSGLLSFGMSQMGGVAWFAHIGGFVAGLLLIKPFTWGRRPRDAWWLSDQF